MITVDLAAECGACGGPLSPRPGHTLTWWCPDCEEAGPILVAVVALEPPR